MFAIGQLVRAKTGEPGVNEVVRLLPVSANGARLYVIRNARGVERVARHDELKRA